MIAPSPLCPQYAPGPRRIPGRGDGRASRARGFALCLAISCTWRTPGCVRLARPLRVCGCRSAGMPSRGARGKAAPAQSGSRPTAARSWDATRAAWEAFPRTLPRPLERVRAGRTGDERLGAGASQAFEPHGRERAPLRARGAGRGAHPATGWRTYPEVPGLTEGEEPPQPNELRGHRWRPPPAVRGRGGPSSDGSPCKAYWWGGPCPVQSGLAGVTSSRNPRQPLRALPRPGPEPSRIPPGSRRRRRWSRLRTRTA